MRTSSNYALRLPTSLKRAVEEIALEDGTTLNQFIISAVAEKLAVLNTADYFARCTTRADFAGFDRLMSRRDGEAPRPEDGLPESYRKRKSTGRRRARRRTPTMRSTAHRSMAPGWEFDHEANRYRAIALRPKAPR
jgi:hypothetical protein